MSFIQIWLMVILNTVGERMSGEGKLEVAMISDVMSESIGLSSSSQGITVSLGSCAVSDVSWRSGSLS